MAARKRTPQGRGKKGANPRGPIPLSTLVDNDEVLAHRASRLSERVVFTVATRTRSGTPLQEAKDLSSKQALDRVRPDLDAAERAIRRLETEGFKVLHRGRFGLTVLGSSELVSRVLDTPLRLKRRPAPLSANGLMELTAPAVSPMDLYLAPPSLAADASRLDESIDHFVFIPPPLYFSEPSPTAPVPGFAVLTVETMRKLLEVTADAGRGAGIKVAMIDNGFFPHPYFAQNHYKLTVLDSPGVPPGSETVDDIGHGTAMASNVFALAPDVELIGIKNSPTPSAAVEVAVESGARILTCSWGWDREQSFPVLEATLRDAVVSDGLVLLFASGNGQRAWPGSMPEVLSIGGVYADLENGNALQASNYASGFLSDLYPNRLVPDFCGLCGQQPNGIYIPMPTQPGSEKDMSYGGNPFPYFDETEKTDGWIVASGTSSAAPQIAGVVALLLERAAQKGKNLSSEDIRKLLASSATAVTTGRNAFHFPASEQVPNIACGYGLVNAQQALAGV